MLQNEIENFLHDCNLHELAYAAEQLSGRYKDASHGHYAHSDLLKKAYIATRMPATYQAICYVLNEVKKRSIEPKTIIDFGSGPGTAVWAALELFEAIDFTLIEKDPEFIAIAKVLLNKQKGMFNWKVGLCETAEFAEHDLAIFSYSLNEINKASRASMLEKVWQRCQTVAILEPGTPRGFENILEARRILIDLGADIAAPCPHNQICSLRRNPKDKESWCHFSVRLERSFLHKYAKAATLPYEDEKFSYIIATRILKTPTKQRLLSSPVKRPGHMHLHLCTPDGLKDQILSKKNKEIYQQAKKLDWGDDLEPV